MLNDEEEEKNKATRQNGSRLTISNLFLASDKMYRVIRLDVASSLFILIRLADIIAPV